MAQRYERYAHIVGWGMSVPVQVLTNHDLAQKIDTTDMWIQTHTGIKERRIAGPKETTFSLALHAAEDALDMAGLAPEELDLIVVATSTPEYIFPATACLLQDALGARFAAAFDLSAACTGFVYALSIATQSVRSGAARSALVVGAETMSRIVNWKDRSTCILFGDGAGAVVLRESPEPGGVMHTYMRSDGSGADLLLVPGGGSRHPATAESVAGGLHTIHMDGGGVFRFAIRALSNAAKRVMADGAIGVDQVALIIPHQANLRIIQAAARAMGVPVEKFFVNVERYGNTSAASIPIALCEAVKQGRLKPDDQVILVGFGGGLTWGATLVKWDVTPTPPTLRRRVTIRARRTLSNFISLWTRILRRLESWLTGSATETPKAAPLEKPRRERPDRPDRPERTEKRAEPRAEKRPAERSLAEDVEDGASKDGASKDGALAKDGRDGKDGKVEREKEKEL
jgi:3-oxoacyl-[acyl-carrier-protein] synthase-3